MADTSLDLLNQTQIDLLQKYDDAFNKLGDKAKKLAGTWQSLADKAKNQIDTAINNTPIINLFSNPSLSTDKDGNVLGLTIGYKTHIQLFEMKIENDSGGAWWQSGGKRLKITIQATNNNGSGCCGNWYLALRLNNIPTSIPTNAHGIPLTYSFEYKILNKTSNKSRIKIGWEKGAGLDSSVSDKWKKAYMVYTHPAQRGYFISFYPAEKNAKMEILIRNIVVAPGVVGDKFSNYTSGA